MRELIEKLVSCAAGRYRRRVWWADEQELKQVGHVACLEAAFDPEVGVEPERYFWRVVILAMRRHLWHESAPISGGYHRARELRGGITRTSLLRCSVVEQGESNEEEWLASEGMNPEELVDDATWRARVRARLEDLAKADTDIIAIILEEKQPALVAAERGVHVSKVYTKAARLRQKAAVDSELWELTQVRKEG